MKLWRIYGRLPNLPKFSPANVSLYTVFQECSNELSAHLAGTAKCTDNSLLHSLRMVKCAMLDL